MTRKTIADLLCSLRTFVYLLAIGAVSCIVVPTEARATGKPEPTANQSASSSATAGAHAGASAGSSSAIDLSLMNAPAGASIRQGNSYSLMGAAPLPPGLCPKGDSVSIVIFSWSTNRTDMECLDKILNFLRETAPAKQVEVRYVSIYPAPEAKPAEPVAECKVEPPKPRKAKSGTPRGTNAEHLNCKRS